MKKNCCERLANDAEIRKNKLKIKKQAEIVRIDEQMKLLFKPKINTTMPSRKLSNFIRSDDIHTPIGMSPQNITLTNKVDYF